MPSTARFMAFAIFLSCAATPAFAQVTSPSGSRADVDTDRNSITIGAGAGYMPSYEGSNDYVVVPVGAARGQVDRHSFFTRNTQLYINALQSPSGPAMNFELGVIGGVNINRTGNLVDPRMEALGRRKLAVELGGFVGVGKTGVITSDYDNITLRVAYVHDVAGIYKSYVITPQLQYTTPLSRKAFVGLAVSADYAGTGYATAYYDVDAAGSARSGLPVFTGRAGWKDVSFSLLAGHSLTGDLLHGLGIYVNGSYTRLQNDFAASPVTSIAGSPGQWFGAVGLGYSF
jgi:outer membrane scaffolding protein for murein synthesis (MipA/OmpV family)